MYYKIIARLNDNKYKMEDIKGNEEYMDKDTVIGLLVSGKIINDSIVNVYGYDYIRDISGVKGET